MKGGCRLLPCMQFLCGCYSSVDGRVAILGLAYGVDSLVGVGGDYGVVMSGGGGREGVFWGRCWPARGL